MSDAWEKHIDVPDHLDIVYYADTTILSRCSSSRGGGGGGGGGGRSLCIDTYIDYI